MVSGVKILLYLELINREGSNLIASKGLFLGNVYGVFKKDFLVFTLGLHYNINFEKYWW